MATKFYLELVLSTQSHKNVTYTQYYLLIYPLVY
jgi:hypothetical protein